MTENELRQAVVAQATAWLGCNEADGSHRVIIDLYNKYRPAGGYKVGYNDPWCATFVSAAGMAVAAKYRLACGVRGLIPVSPACDPMIEDYTRMGRWAEDDAFLPSNGDLIFYDWEDSGAGDNHGSTDHVGIVASVAGNTISVIEGNKSDSVCYRTIQRNGRFIRGYGRPDYARWAETAQTPVDGKEGEVTIIIDPPAEETEGDAKPAAKPLVTGLPVLRKGDKGEVVRAAQLLLIGRGFRCGPWGADGDFGWATYGALYQFQRARRLAVDGVLGPESWSGLLGLTL